MVKLRNWKEKLWNWVQWNQNHLNDQND
jgi:hypothetical protein